MPPFLAPSQGSVAAFTFGEGGIISELAIRIVPSMR